VDPGLATAYPVSRPLARMAARGRPSSDPACAGCAQLGLFRALRRAGLEVQGGSGCDPDRPPPLAPSGGRWAAVVGAAAILEDAAGTVASAAGAGARLVVLADRDGVRGRRAARALAAAAGRTAPVDARDLAAAEAAVRAAVLAPGSALVALTPCARLRRRAASLAVAAARCNRCGACLALGCAAITDEGGEAMVVDRAACTGCALCVPLCRGRAIGASR
jgi:Pyruvate/2-oxoacid:ferredoxin oxidoreductase delta subunit